MKKENFNVKIIETGENIKGDPVDILCRLYLGLSFDSFLDHIREDWAEEQKKIADLSEDKNYLMEAVE